MSDEQKELLKTYADLNWCIDILERIEVAMDRNVTNDDPFEEIRYLVKQGLKVKREK